MKIKTQIVGALTEAQPILFTKPELLKMGRSRLAKLFREFDQWTRSQPRGERWMGDYHRLLKAAWKVAKEAPRG